MASPAATRHTPSPATDRRRVILYARVSKDDRDGLSPTGQLSGLRRWAEQNDREVVAELRDDGISASRFAGGKPRPDWTEARRIIETGGADELAVRKISRATRDRETWARLVGACIAHGVAIVADGRAYDPALANDGFRLDLDAALAVRDSAEISENTLKGKREAAALGRPAANLNFGYRPAVGANGRPGRRDPLVWDFGHDEPRRTWLPDAQEPYLREVDPTTGPVVREVVTRLLDGNNGVGESASSIVADLNRRAVPALRGGRWTAANLGRMVVNPVYIGQRRYTDTDGQEHTVPGLWPPLVTRDEHDRLVALYAAPEREKYRSTSITRHLGTGIYRCGRPGCPGRMRVVIGRTDGGRADRYSCRECHKVSRRQEPVDRLVQRLVVAYLSTPGIAEQLAARAGDDPDAKAAQADVARLTRQLAELREKVDAGALSLDDLAYFRARWEPQLNAAQERARPRHLPGAVWAVAGPDAERKWKATSIEARRTILGALFTITIHPAGSGKWVFDPSLITVEWRED